MVKLPTEHKTPSQLFANQTRYCTGAWVAAGALDGEGIVGVAGMGTGAGVLGIFRARSLGRVPETGGIQRLWAIRFFLMGAIKLYPPFPSGNMGVPQRFRQTTCFEGIFSPAKV